MIHVREMRFWQWIVHRAVNTERVIGKRRQRSRKHAGLVLELGLMLVLSLLLPKSRRRK